MKGPALADVAKKAGVSVATASRVLNGKGHIAEATRAAVVEAADELGYDRTFRLRRASKGLVGLVVPELANPVFPAFAQVIENSLANAGYTPMLCTQTPGGMHEDDFVATLLGRGAAGVIHVSGLHANTAADPARYARQRENGVPIVLVNGHVAGVDAPFISNDDAGAVEAAVAHLVQLGHTRIGLAVGPERYVPVIRKVAGFRNSMAEHLGCVDLDGLVAHAAFSVEGGRESGASLLDAGCTGIVCASDLMALGVIAEARSRGLQVPADVSVVGHDDSLLVAYTDPPLTTLRQDVEGMGRAAVRALLQEIHGESVTHAEYVFRPELIVRGSTAPCRGAY